MPLVVRVDGQWSMVASDQMASDRLIVRRGNSLAPHHRTIRQKLGMAPESGRALANKALKSLALPTGIEPVFQP